MLKGLMQDFPLTLDLVLRRALELGGEVDVVSATPAGIDRRSWRELGERALRLGGVLDELGVPAGGRVGTFAWNGHRHVELFLGAPCAGRVVHAVNVRLTGDQIVHLTGHAGDDVLFVDASLTGLLAPLRERLAVREIVVMEDGAPVHEAFAGCRRYEELLAGQEASWKPRRPEEGDAAWICHTSGTTGCPKAVVSSHRSVVLHSLASLQVDSHGVSRQDTVLPITPMFHANAWGMPYTAALAAARLVLPGGDASPEALAQLVEAERVTIAAGVPTVFIRMLEAFDGGRDLSSLRRVLVGGAPPPRSLVAELVRRGIEFMQGWGMTEMSPSGTALTVRPGAELGGEEGGAVTSVGHATPLVELRHVAEDGTVLPWDGEAVGELEARGPWVIRAYLDPDDDANHTRFHDGWLRTGDLGRIFPDGRVELVDRAKDLIKSGGEWISSIELEQALATHPAVGEAVVVGIPDAQWGERPAALVVPAAGRRVEPGELVDFLRGRVARWWLPDLVRVVDEIPKTPVGKYDKRRLRAELAEELERAPGARR
ncbi:MAG TPA: long-chain-fatty-acid--CoA ligase [Gaiellaceae bacterium]|nr:long-chain-fatty-acid--CoA ligase [Gaiellaceae bacterium]